MDVRREQQAALVADVVAALTAITRPVVASVFQSIGDEYLDAYGRDRGKVPLKMLGRLRKAGDGDCGVAFEYAIHEALRTGHGVVVDRVATALSICRISQGAPSSILFAIEKQGSKQLISTELELVTDNSRVLSGRQGQPVKLKKHLNQLAAAFRRPSTRPNLPQSIRGLWKADLFLGSVERDHWVGTSVKINPSHLEAAAGLRVAVVPMQFGKSDAIRRDDARNLVICPVPHDGSFMQAFYEGWRIVQVLCGSDFKTPKDVDLPHPAHREVARIYVERRDYPVLDVLAATEAFAQPQLLETRTVSVPTAGLVGSPTPGTATIISPFPLVAE